MCFISFFLNCSLSSTARNAAGKQFQTRDSERSITEPCPCPWYRTREGDSWTHGEENMWTAGFKCSWRKRESAAQDRAGRREVVCSRMFHGERQGISHVKSLIQIMSILAWQISQQCRCISTTDITVLIKHSRPAIIWKKSGERKIQNCFTFLNSEILPFSAFCCMHRSKVGRHSFWLCNKMRSAENTCIHVSTFMGVRKIPVCT